MGKFDKVKQQRLPYKELNKLFSDANNRSFTWISSVKALISKGCFQDEDYTIANMVTFIPKKLANLFNYFATNEIMLTPHQFKELDNLYKSAFNLFTLKKGDSLLQLIVCILPHYIDFHFMGCTNSDVDYPLHIKEKISQLKEYPRIGLESLVRCHSLQLFTKEISETHKKHIASSFSSILEFILRKNKKQLMKTKYLFQSITLIKIALSLLKEADKPLYGGQKMEFLSLLPSIPPNFHQWVSNLGLPYTLDENFTILEIIKNIYIEPTVNILFKENKCDEEVPSDITESNSSKIAHPIIKTSVPMQHQPEANRKSPTLMLKVESKTNKGQTVKSRLKNSKVCQGNAENISTDVIPTSKSPLQDPTLSKKMKKELTINKMKTIHDREELGLLSNSCKSVSNVGSPSDHSLLPPKEFDRIMNKERPVKLKKLTKTAINKQKLAELCKVASKYFDKNESNSEDVSNTSKKNIQRENIICINASNVAKVLNESRSLFKETFGTSEEELMPFVNCHSKRPSEENSPNHSRQNRSIDLLNKKKKSPVTKTELEEKSIFLDQNHNNTKQKKRPDKIAITASKIDKQKKKKSSLKVSNVNELKSDAGKSINSKRKLKKEESSLSESNSITRPCKKARVVLEAPQGTSESSIEKYHEYLLSKGWKITPLEEEDKGTESASTKNVSTQHKWNKNAQKTAEKKLPKEKMVAKRKFEEMATEEDKISRENIPPTKEKGTNTCVLLLDNCIANRMKKLETNVAEPPNKKLKAAPTDCLDTKISSTDENKTLQSKRAKKKKKNMTAKSQDVPSSSKEQVVQAHRPTESKQGKILPKTSSEPNKKIPLVLSAESRTKLVKASSEDASVGTTRRLKYVKKKKDWLEYKDTQNILKNFGSDIPKDLAEISDASESSQDPNKSDSDDQTKQITEIDDGIAIVEEVNLDTKVPFSKNSSKKKSRKNVSKSSGIPHTQKEQTVTNEVASTSTVETSKEDDQSDSDIVVLEEFGIPQSRHEVSKDSSPTLEEDAANEDNLSGEVATTSGAEDNLSGEVATTSGVEDNLSGEVATTSGTEDDLSNVATTSGVKKATVDTIKEKDIHTSNSMMVNLYKNKKKMRKERSRRRENANNRINVINVSNYNELEISSSTAIADLDEQLCRSLGGCLEREIQTLQTLEDTIINEEYKENNISKARNSNRVEDSEDEIVIVEDDESSIQESQDKSVNPEPKSNDVEIVYSISPTHRQSAQKSNSQKPKESECSLIQNVSFEGFSESDLKNAHGFSDPIQDSYLDSPEDSSTESFESQPNEKESLEEIDGSTKSKSSPPKDFKWSTPTNELRKEVDTKNTDSVQTNCDSDLEMPLHLSSSLESLNLIHEGEETKIPESSVSDANILEVPIIDKPLISSESPAKSHLVNGEKNQAEITELPNGLDDDSKNEFCDPQIVNGEVNSPTKDMNGSVPVPFVNGKLETEAMNSQDSKNSEEEASHSESSFESSVSVDLSDKEAQDLLESRKVDSISSESQEGEIKSHNGIVEEPVDVTEKFSPETINGKVTEEEASESSHESSDNEESKDQPEPMEDDSTPSESDESIEESSGGETRPEEYSKQGEDSKVDNHGDNSNRESHPDSSEDNELPSSTTINLNGLMEQHEEQPLQNETEETKDIEKTSSDKTSRKSPRFTRRRSTRLQLEETSSDSSLSPIAKQNISKILASVNSNSEKLSQIPENVDQTEIIVVNGYDPEDEMVDIETSDTELSPFKSPAKSPCKKVDVLKAKSPSVPKSPAKSPCKNVDVLKAKSPSPSKSPAKSPCIVDAVKVKSPSLSKSPAKSPCKIVDALKAKSPSPSKSPAKSPCKIVDALKAKSPSPFKSPAKSPCIVDAVKAKSPSLSKSPAKSPCKIVDALKAKSPSPSKSPAKSPFKKVEGALKAKSPNPQKSTSISSPGKICEEIEVLSTNESTQINHSPKKKLLKTLNVNGDVRNNDSNPCYMSPEKIGKEIISSEFIISPNMSWQEPSANNLEGQIENQVEVCELEGQEDSPKNDLQEEQVEVEVDSEKEFVQKKKDSQTANSDDNKDSPKTSNQLVNISATSTPTTRRRSKIIAESSTTPVPALSPRKTRGMAKKIEEVEVVPKRGRRSVCVSSVQDDVAFALSPSRNLRSRRHSGSYTPQRSRRLSGASDAANDSKKTALPTLLEENADKHKKKLNL